jgi:hypothetical protein
MTFCSSVEAAALEGRRELFRYQARASDGEDRNDGGPCGTFAKLPKQSLG